MTPSGRFTSLPSCWVRLCVLLRRDARRSADLWRRAAVFPLVPALLTSNFYLGKMQNAVEGSVHTMYDVQDERGDRKAQEGAEK